MKKNKTLPKKPSILYNDQPANDQPQETEQTQKITDKLLTPKEKRACDQATD
tara:strand:- start:47020 stop:47175 length:156 start_codon:yes stop_codon:yes gene_type:complete